MSDIITMTEVGSKAEIGQVVDTHFEGQLTEVDLV